jgi:hypothetical protein
MMIYRPEWLNYPLGSNKLNEMYPTTKHFQLGFKGAASYP